MSDVPASTPVPPNPGTALDSAILRLLMETSPDHLYFKDLESRFVRNNTAHARSFGRTPEECVGKTDFDFFAQEHASMAYADEQEIIRSGRPIINKIERVTRRGGTRGWMSTTKLPWRDADGKIIGTFGVTRDITAEQDASEKLEAERKLLRTIIDLIPSRIYVKDAAERYLLNNRAHLTMLGVTSQDEATGHTLRDFHPGERGQQAHVDDTHVIATGESILSQEKSNFGAEGLLRWSLTTKVPFLDTGGKIIGLVGISHDITRRKLMEQELQTRTAEMEADVRMARQVQEAFFPRATPIFTAGGPGAATALRFAHHYAPAATLGGDFFDIVQLSETRCGVLLCDVMGHGVRAGLLTALIRGVVEELGARGDDPAHVLGEINRGLMPIVHQTGQPVFATAFFGVIDTAAGTLTYANAGHPAPLVLRTSTGAMERLTFENPEPAAGLVEDFAYSRGEVPFRPGDRLLGYTDGLFEASDAAGVMFGETRLRQLIGESAALSGEQLIERLVREVIAFTGRNEFDDDICLVSVESAPAA